MTSRRMETALRKIAKGEYNSLSANPTEWPAVIAYLGLGGRIKNGQMLDDIDSLPAEPSEQ